MDHGKLIGAIVALAITAAITFLGPCSSDDPEDGAEELQEDEVLIEEVEL